MDKDSGAERTGHSHRLTNEDLVQAFADLFDETAPCTPEEVDAILREFGYDPDKLAERIRAAAERAMAASSLNWRAKGRAEAEGEEGDG